jgi:hypothetical protein
MEDGDQAVKEAKARLPFFRHPVHGSNQRKDGFAHPKNQTGPEGQR